MGKPLIVVADSTQIRPPEKKHGGVAPASPLNTVVLRQRHRADPNHRLKIGLDDGLAHTATSITACVHRGLGIRVHEPDSLASLEDCPMCGSHRYRRRIICGAIDELSGWSITTLVQLDPKSPASRIFEPRRSNAPFVRNTPLKRIIATPEYSLAGDWYEVRIDVWCPHCGDLDEEQNPVWQTIVDRHGLRKFGPARLMVLRMQSRITPNRLQLLPKERSVVWNALFEYRSRFANSGMHFPGMQFVSPTAGTV